MTIKISECKSDECFEEYATFFLTYKKDIYPSCNVLTIVNLMCDAFLRSNIVLLHNEQKEILGCAVYYVDQETQAIVIEQTLLHPEYRGTITFVRGMQKVVNHILRFNQSVKTLTFHAEVNNKYINNMYSKLTTKVSEIEVLGEKRNLYSIDMKQLNRIQKRYIERR